MFFCCFFPLAISCVFFFCAFEIILHSTNQCFARIKTQNNWVFFFLFFFFQNFYTKSKKKPKIFSNYLSFMIRVNHSNVENQNRNFLLLVENDRIWIRIGISKYAWWWRYIYSNGGLIVVVVPVDRTSFIHLSKLCCRSSKVSHTHGSIFKRPNENSTKNMKNECHSKRRKTVKKNCR